MNDLAQSAVDAFNSCVASGNMKSEVDAYTQLMSLYDASKASDEEFKKRFTGFYRLRRSALFRNVYFEIMDEQDPDSPMPIEQVMERLRCVSGNIELSFASKLLATVNPNAPIWDSGIQQALKKWGSANSEQEFYRQGPMADAVRKYEQLQRFYSSIEEDGTADLWVKTFDESFPEAGISRAKKIDFVLWSYGSSLQDK